MDAQKSIQVWITALKILHSMIKDDLLKYISSNHKKQEKNIKNLIQGVERQQLRKVTIEVLHKILGDDSDTISFSSLAKPLKEALQRKFKNNAEEQYNSRLQEALRSYVNYQKKELLVSGDYIGHLEDHNLAFYRFAHHPNSSFYATLLNILQNAIPNIPLKCIHIGDEIFKCFFIEVFNLFEYDKISIKIHFDEYSCPPDSNVNTTFAKALIKARPGAFDGLSFGLNQAWQEDGVLHLRLVWCRYIDSLQRHDAYYMSSIFKYDPNSVNNELDNQVNLTKNILLNFKNGISLSTNPVLGCTAAIAFKKKGDARFWTFVQIKGDWVTCIPELHLTPSFTHQSISNINTTLKKEAEDFEFHIYRELMEEIFDYKEKVTKDFYRYKEVIYSLRPINMIEQMRKNNTAFLNCEGLFFDVQRNKFELVYTLVITDEQWYKECMHLICGNHEAIPGGVITMPCDISNLNVLLTGKLTNDIVRFLCAPGQAGLFCLLRRLEQQHGYKPS